MEHARLIETEGHPLVYADWLHAAGKPTALIYGHYDVQPPDPLDEWLAPPFEPTERDGNLYARVGSFPQVPMGEAVFQTLPSSSPCVLWPTTRSSRPAARPRPTTWTGPSSFLGRDKQQRTLSFGGNLLALYTHEVHHRGGVATILDGWGVENDWSSLMRFLFQ